VYRHDPATGATSRVAGDLDKPNGLVFSPDESVLYVSDNGAPHHLLAFDVLGAGLGRRRVVAAGDPGHPDGLSVDTEGNVYCSAAQGIRVHARDGTPIGEISLPGSVNFTFGGHRRTTLYVTADTAVWAVSLQAKGA
jgi:gluconolactonase